MPRGSKPVKTKLWTERMERFARAGQTVAQFCRDERVSQPSFYHWKKKLANQGQTNSAPPKFEPAFQAVEVTANGLAATTIRLANGVQIELGGDLQVVQAVVKQVLETVDSDPRAAGGSSC